MKFQCAWIQLLFSLLIIVCFMLHESTAVFGDADRHRTQQQSHLLVVSSPNRTTTSFREVQKIRRAAETEAVLNVVEADNAMQLANTIAGKNVQVISVEFDGRPAQAGIFTKGLSVIYLDSGIVLSSGLAVDAMGPGTNTYGTLSDDDPDVLFVGYPPLGNLTNQTTYNAAVLTIEFECEDAGELTLLYVFASEEYSEAPYSAYQWEDVMGIFLDGVEPADNIATLEGTHVSVNQVNCDGSNPLCKYYVNGKPSLAEMNGFTKVLRASAAIDSGTSVIRIAVADGYDGESPAWVFIGENSLLCPITSEPPSVQPSSNPSAKPSFSPTMLPSSRPSSFPSLRPSSSPSSEPSDRPSEHPSASPSMLPSGRPSASPTIPPSARPTTPPTRRPTTPPTRRPSTMPSQMPSKAPIRVPPKRRPTRRPSSHNPTTRPSNIQSKPTVLNPHDDLEDPTNVPTFAPTPIQKQEEGSPSLRPNSNTHSTLKPNQETSSLPPSHDPAPTAPYSPTLKPNRKRPISLMKCLQRVKVCPCSSSTKRKYPARKCIRNRAYNFCNLPKDDNEEDNPNNGNKDYRKKLYALFAQSCRQKERGPQKNAKNKMNIFSKQNVTD